MVWWQNAEELVSALDAVGAEYTLYTMQNSDHDLGSDPKVKDAFYADFLSHCVKYFGY